MYAYTLIKCSAYLANIATDFFIFMVNRSTTMTFSVQFSTFVRRHLRHNVADSAFMIVTFSSFLQNQFKGNVSDFPLLQSC
ncbi:hypothetical protein GCM10009347_08250 [Shewanella algicola]|nr:hypothetical protein GCM10009347_08250 [Shewanella algicola]